MEKITITVHADGSITTEVKGVKGKGCKALTKEVEKAFGKAKTKLTPEYNLKEDKRRVRLGG